MEREIEIICIDDEDDSGYNQPPAPAVERVEGSGEMRRPPPRFPSAPGTVVISDGEDEADSGSREAPVPAVQAVPGPRAVRKALLALQPPASSIIINSDGEEDEAAIPCPTPAVPESQQRLVPDAEPMPASRPDMSVPLRPIATTRENVPVNSLNAEMRLRKELEDDKEKIKNQDEELEALKTNLDQCRRELRKEQEENKKLKEQLEKEKKKVECLEAGRKGTAKMTPASKSRATETLQQRDAVAGPSRQAPVVSPPPAKKTRGENVVVAGEQASPKPFPCENCERGFDSERGLVSHSSKVHKNPKQKPRAGGNKYATRSSSGTDEVARRTRSARNQK